MFETSKRRTQSGARTERSEYGDEYDVPRSRTFSAALQRSLLEFEVVRSPREPRSIACPETSVYGRFF